MVSVFTKESTRILRTIRWSIELRDGDMLRRAAHELCSACGNFGARPVLRLCERLESLGRTGEIANAASLVDALTIEHERLEFALASAIQEAPRL